MVMIFNLINIVWQIRLILAKKKIPKYKEVSYQKENNKEKGV